MSISNSLLSEYKKQRNPPYFYVHLSGGHPKKEYEKIIYDIAEIYTNVCRYLSNQKKNMFVCEITSRKVKQKILASGEFQDNPCAYLVDFLVIIHIKYLSKPGLRHNIASNLAAFQPCWDRINDERTYWIDVVACEGPGSFCQAPQLKCMPKIKWRKIRCPVNHILAQSKA